MEDAGRCLLRTEPFRVLWIRSIHQNAQNDDQKGDGYGRDEQGNGF